MNYNDATKTKVKLGDYQALNFPLKPLQPYPHLIHLNFKVVAKNKAEFEKHFLASGNRPDAYQTYTGEFTVAVEFANDLNIPTEKREINYEHFVKENEWENVLN